MRQKSHHLGKPSLMSSISEQRRCNTYMLADWKVRILTNGNSFIYTYIYIERPVERLWVFYIPKSNIKHWDQNSIDPVFSWYGIRFCFVNLWFFVHIVSYVLSYDFPASKRLWELKKILFGKFACDLGFAGPDFLNLFFNLFVTCFVTFCTQNRIRPNK